MLVVKPELAYFFWKLEVNMCSFPNLSYLNVRTQHFNKMLSLQSGLFLFMSLSILKQLWSYSNKCFFSLNAITNARKAQECLGKVRFVRRRNTTNFICAWTPTGGWSMWLWESLSHICIQIVKEHSNESWKFTLFLKMSGNANAMVRLRFQLMISKNIYCSGFKETLTSAHYFYLLKQPKQYSFNSDLVSIYLYTFFKIFVYFFKEGWKFLCAIPHYFSCINGEICYMTRGNSKLLWKKIINILKFCALVKIEWSRMV